MLQAHVTHTNHTENEQLKCFYYDNRSIDFINSTFKR